MAGMETGFPGMGMPGMPFLPMPMGMSDVQMAGMGQMMMAYQMQQMQMYNAWQMGMEQGMSMQGMNMQGTTTKGNSKKNMKAEAKDANAKLVANISRKAWMEGDAPDIAQNKKDKKDDAASDSVFLKDAKVREAYIGLAELFGLKMSDDKDSLEVGDFPEHLKLNFKEDRGTVSCSSPGCLSYRAFSLCLLKPNGEDGSDPRKMQEKKDIVWALAQTSAGSRMLQALLIWNELTEWPDNYKVEQLERDRNWLAGCFEDKIEQAHMGLGRKHANYVIQTICKHTTRVEMVAKEVVGKGGDLCLKMTLDQMGCRTLNRLVEKLLDEGMVVYGPMMLEILLKPETLKEVS